MSSFITQCPNCKTSFNITQAQLKLAKGKVRCGFCLQTFSALEQQLFIEDELPAIQPHIRTINDNTGSNDNNEEAASDRAIETFSEESTETTIEETSHFTNSLYERNNTKKEEPEISPPEYEQTDSENLEASDDDEEPEDNLYIDRVLEDEEVITTEEALDESTEQHEEGKEANKEEGTKEEGSENIDAINTEYEAVETIDEEPQTSTRSDLEELEEKNGSDITATTDEEDGKAGEDVEAVEDDYEALSEIEESSIEQELPEATELKEYLEENRGKKEEIKAAIKEQLLEIDTRSIATSSPEAIKKKKELQSLEALYDDDALNTDGSNPVSSISEEPIPIYRQYSRPAIVTSLLYFCNVLLIIALGAQYAWANFDTYLRESRFSSLTGFVCNYANCPDVQRFDLSAFSTDQLVVNSHPSISNALQIDFIFRNTAEFEQELPLVELNFSDLNRRLVANRLFTPEEYLEQDLQQFSHLPPNSSIQIRLEIADPGPEAINYALTLRTP